MPCRRRAPFRSMPTHSEAADFVDPLPYNLFGEDAEGGYATISEPTSILQEFQNCLPGLQPAQREFAWMVERSHPGSVRARLRMTRKHTEFDGFRMQAGDELVKTSTRDASGSKGPQLLTLLDVWSGKRDSNSRPQPWQGCALPTELFPRRAPAPKQASNCRAGSPGVKDIRSASACFSVQGVESTRNFQ